MDENDHQPHERVGDCCGFRNQLYTRLQRRRRHGGTAHETATLSRVDETAAHFVLTVDSASGTGAFASPPFGPNDFFYVIYTMFGNSFQIEDNGMNNTTYRTSFDVNAQVWSK